MERTTKILLIICIVLFTLAGMLTLAGALCKLQHWPMGSTLLQMGLVLQIASFLFGGISLIRYLRNK